MRDLVTTAYYDTAPLPFSAITFDVSRFLIEGYQYADALPQTGEYIFNENILNRFYLKCYEYYDVLGNGIYEIDLSTEVVSNTYTCFAGSFNFFDRPEWNPNDYNGTASSYYPLTDQLQFQLHKNFFKVFTFYNPNNVIDNIIIERVDTTGTSSITTTPPANVGSYDLTHFTLIPVDFGANNQTLYFNIYVEYTNGLGTNTNKHQLESLLKNKRADDGYVFSNTKEFFYYPIISSFNTSLSNAGETITILGSHFTNITNVFFNFKW
jgi:hypothetical protein